MTNLEQVLCRLHLSLQLHSKYSKHHHHIADGLEELFYVNTLLLEQSNTPFLIYRLHCIWKYTEMIKSSSPCISEVSSLLITEWSIEPVSIAILQYCNAIPLGEKSNGWKVLWVVDIRRDIMHSD